MLPGALTCSSPSSNLTQQFLSTEISLGYCTRLRIIYLPDSLGPSCRGRGPRTCTARTSASGKSRLCRRSTRSRPCCWTGLQKSLYHEPPIRKSDLIIIVLSALFLPSRPDQAWLRLPETPLFLTTQQPFYHSDPLVLVKVQLRLD